MATTCPNCGKKLHLWNIKAECSACGVSIPNYNWEERLEEDNVKAEKAFTTFYRTLNRIAYSIWGTKLRIARLVLTFLPAIGFILPWATVKSDGTNFTLSVISLESGMKTLIHFFKCLFGNMSLFFTNMGIEGGSGPVILMFASYLLFVLSAVAIVVAFLMVLIRCKYPKTKSTVVCDVLSIALSVASVVCFVVAGSRAADMGAYNFGDYGVINAVGSISWGYFVSLALLIIATGTNIAVIKAPAKSDEQLEDERLARKAVKEEKERIADEKREIERAEAEKRQAEEEKEKVANAKARLAEKAEKEKEKAKK